MSDFEQVERRIAGILAPVPNNLFNSVARYARTG